jgi:hypothetical protein
LHRFALIVDLCDFSTLIYPLGIMRFRFHSVFLLGLGLFSQHIQAAEPLLPALPASAVGIASPALAANTGKAATASDKTVYIEAQKVEKTGEWRRMAMSNCSKAIKKSTPIICFMSKQRAIFRPTDRFA